MSDEAVAHRAAKDVAFVAELIRRYQQKLDTYIRRRSHASERDREDMLQNIFIKMYQNLNDFDTSLLFSSWIYRIAHNEMIDWYRKEGKRTTHSIDGDEALSRKIVADVHIEQSLDEAALHAAVRAALTNLPPDYRDILLLRYFEEKSYDEIADILQIPPGTVAIRINRAKKRLVEPLARQYYSHT